MEIYVDVIVAENFVVNLFLLTITMKIIKHKSSILRLILASFIGGLYTLVLFIPGLKVFTLVPCALMVACIMLLICYGKTNFINMVKLLGIFLMVTFTLSGICFALSLKQNGYILGNKFEICNYSIKYMMLGVMMLYVVLARIVEYLRERLFVNNYTCAIEFDLGYKNYKLNAFLDTGNELKEPITNLPCILIEEKFIDDINFDNKNVYDIPYSSVEYGGKLKGVRVNKIKIKGNDFSRDEIDAIICPCKAKLSKEDEFNALLSRGVV